MDVQTDTEVKQNPLVAINHSAACLRNVLDKFLLSCNTGLVCLYLYIKRIAFVNAKQTAPVTEERKRACYWHSWGLMLQSRLASQAHRWLVLCTPTAAFYEGASGTCIFSLLSRCHEHNFFVPSNILRDKTSERMSLYSNSTETWFCHIKNGIHSCFFHSIVQQRSDGVYLFFFFCIKDVLAGFRWATRFFLMSILSGYLSIFTYVLSCIL